MSNVSHMNKTYNEDSFLNVSFFHFAFLKLIVIYFLFNIRKNHTYQYYHILLLIVLYYITIPSTIHTLVLLQIFEEKKVYRKVLHFRISSERSEYWVHLLHPIEFCFIHFFRLRLFIYLCCLVNNFQKCFLYIKQFHN